MIFSYRLAFDALLWGGEKEGEGKEKGGKGREGGVCSSNISFKKNPAAPRYLTELEVPVASTARRRLRSVSSADLVMPSTRRSTIGDRAFAVAGPRAWNSLPSDIRSSTLHHHSARLRNI